MVIVLVIYVKYKLYSIYSQSVSEKMIFLHENFFVEILKNKSAPLISRQEVQWKKYLKSIKYIINI